jgi:hypothetical protein
VSRRRIFALTTALALATSTTLAHARDTQDTQDAQDPHEEEGLPLRPPPSAVESPSPPVAPAPPPERPLPDFMRNKQRMTASDLADKTEGGYFTGLPLINSDPDTGIGFGARVIYFQNGPRDDVMFGATPYRYRLYGQAFFTTNGYQFHTIDLDAPYLADLPLRLRASLVYEKNTAANYFGLGDRSLSRLAFPGSSDHFASMSDYTTALRHLQPDGTAYTRFNQYVLERPKANVTLERDFFGGVVRGLVGLSIGYVNVRQWTGDAIDADVATKEAPTRLDTECNAGLVIGCGGGVDNTLRAGIAYDTRDYEPDPNSGVFVELNGTFSGKYTLSKYDWARLTFSPRVYYSPFPKLADLVIAARFVGQIQSAGTPFYELNQLSFADYDREGLGGLRTIRGFAQDRFVGPVVALANLEVRWTFDEFDLKVGAKRQHFALMLAPFIDVGRVFDSISDLELKRFRNGQGAGFRIAWNQATIIAIDYGVSREGSNLYINFNHPF